MSAKQKTFRVEYKLAEIKKIYHYERDFAEYGLAKKDIARGRFEVSINLGLDGVKGMVTFKIKADYAHPLGEENIQLFGIITSFNFKIKYFKRTFKTEAPDKYNIPNPIMINFLDIALSGTRGMLAALNTNPSYANFYLPVMDHIKLIKQLKEQTNKS